MHRIYASIHIIYSESNFKQVTRFFIQPCLHLETQECNTMCHKVSLHGLKVHLGKAFKSMLNIYVSVILKCQDLGHPNSRRPVVTFILWELWRNKGLETLSCLLQIIKYYWARKGPMAGSPYWRSKMQAENQFLWQLKEGKHKEHPPFISNSRLRKK